MTEYPELTAALARMMPRSGEYERDRSWLCEDGWVVEYTTTRVLNGPYEGKFVVSAFKPIGKGSRGGRDTAQMWQNVYRRGFAKRKSAKARAEELYWKHNPSRRR